MRCYSIVTAVLTGAMSASAADFVHRATLGPPIPGENHWYGFDVATDGEVALVTEPGDSGLGEQSGAVHVYRDASPGWRHEETLRASDGREFQRFGYSVAGNGARIVVGTLPDEGSDKRQIYVFEFDAGSWSETAIVAALTPMRETDFGRKVDLHGERVIASSEAVSAAYLFRRDSEGRWPLEAKLTTTRPFAYQYSWDVALWNDVALVSAVSADRARGWVFVYRQDGVGWREETVLGAPDGGGPGLGFGISVDVDGGLAAIGAWHHNVSCPEDPFCNAGAVYLFRHDGLAWIPEQRLAATVPGLQFGYSVALAADVLAVGTARETAPGVAYTYRFDGESWSGEQVIESPEPAAGDLFGSAVGVARDVLVVGSLEARFELSGAGRSEVFHRVASEFVRGDCNDDGEIDISDAVSTLSSVFLGEGVLRCADACDSNDDGELDISDPVMTLGVLFLGQGAIPPPRGCGIDPTDDRLRCDARARRCVP